MDPTHLLDQAARLCVPASGKGRPRQADLRRAVSSCYYAIFHKLVELACSQLAGASGEGKDARDTFARAFEHGEMKRASATFRGGTLPNRFAGRYGNANVPEDVKRVADAFIRLQEERHAADYDQTRTYTQTSVRTLVNLSGSAVDRSEAMKATDFGRLYLLSLLTWNKLAKR